MQIKTVWPPLLYIYSATTRLLYKLFHQWHLLVKMYQCMSGKGIFLVESFMTNITLVRFLSCVYSQMALQTTLCWEYFVAEVTSPSKSYKHLFLAKLSDKIWNSKCFSLSSSIYNLLSYCHITMSLRPTYQNINFGKIINSINIHKDKINSHTLDTHWTCIINPTSKYWNTGNR